MTTTEAAIGPLPESYHRAQLRRAAIASTVGTTIEWYDFLLYGQVASIVSRSSSSRNRRHWWVPSKRLASISSALLQDPSAPRSSAITATVSAARLRIATLLLTGLSTFAVGLVP